MDRKRCAADDGVELDWLLHEIEAAGALVDASMTVNEIVAAAFMAGCHASLGRLGRDVQGVLAVNERILEDSDSPFNAGFSAGAGMVLHDAARLDGLLAGSACGARLRAMMLHPSHEGLVA
ncbi:hypothetical protein BSD967_10430 [Bifidobacterium saguini]|uniref:Uncharacterized protein n=1 Tax=Bifidobacterium saguini TaxID=762210 RepID=A0ABX7SBH3_9BIFI|nr:hypothetical protein [Bifidobacterium saguini]QTB90694.1 hypothetical protein BSD967_10430 [Bifidobacterium saguini]